nr:alcohol dehydrogenase catalytic domain-containing protein [Corynebacterium choanae]
MQAAVFHGAGDIRVETVARPTVTEPTDAVIRLVATCVCGSDLWYYRGESDHDVSGIGHEALGVITEVGDTAAGSLQPGQLVIVPFAYSDNTCPHCEVGMHTACRNGGYFGRGALGCQAEYVRVPQAAGTCVPVPPGHYCMSKIKDLLALSDVMGTGYHAIDAALVKPGNTVAVIGDGAVGLSAVLAAKMRGAATIIMLGSRTAARQQLAIDCGATTVISARGQEAIDEVLQITAGIGVDGVAECVGTGAAMTTAIRIARPGAVIGRVGLPHDAPIDELYTFGHNIGVRGGPAPVRAYLDELLAAVLDGDLQPGKVFDYTTTLDNIAAAYAAMDTRQATKTLIDFTAGNGITTTV